jgi:hypothetical protein
VSGVDRLFGLGASDSFIHTSGVAGVKMPWTAFILEVGSCRWHVGWHVVSGVLAVLCGMALERLVGN